MRTPGLAIAATLALMTAACAPLASAPQLVPAPGPSSLAATGQPSTVAHADEDEGLAWASSVVRVDYLSNQNDGGAKLFGVAGGDPAMNGLYTYLALYENPGDGWQVFRLGDFLDYRVLSDSPGRLDLEIRESTMDTATGNIGSRTRHMIVTWTRGPDGAPPTAISVMPAAPAN